MPQRDLSSPAFALMHAPVQQARRSLLLLATLSSIDGTIVVLAASGALSSLAGAIVIGLTTVAGVGAWLAAREGIGPGSPHRWRFLAGLGLAAVTSTVAAAWLGLRIGAAIELTVLPRAVGLVLALVAAEVGGLRIPRPAGLPAPVAVVAAAIPLEVVAWIH